MADVSFITVAIIAEVIIVLIMVNVYFVLKNRQSDFYLHMQKILKHKDLKAYYQNINTLIKRTQRKHDKASKQFSVSHGVEKSEPDDPLLIKCIHNQYDLLHSEVKLIESGDLVPENLADRQRDVLMLLDEFKTIEKAISELNSKPKDSHDNEHSLKDQEEIERLTQQLAEATIQLLEIKEEPSEASAEK